MWKETWELIRGTIPLMITLLFYISIIVIGIGLCYLIEKKVRNKQ